MMMQQDTMERIVPDQIRDDDTAGQLSLELHLERYGYAVTHVLRGDVLDIACGTGYGTRMLATISRNFCVGVDISEEAIAYANERYNHPQVEFVCRDILKYTRNHRFANIVSLETLEHVEDPEKVIEHLYELLLPGGRMIVSAPVTPSVDANPFHVHDFTESGFRDLFSRHGMVEVVSFIQKQPYSLKEVLSKKRKETGHIRKGIISYYLTHPKKFFLRLRSFFSEGLTNKYLILVLERPR